MKLGKNFAVPIIVLMGLCVLFGWNTKALAADVSTYEELVSELAGAGTDSETPTQIKLTSDIAVDAELTVKEETYVILDLNGYVLGHSDSGKSRVIRNNGNLTIRDSRPGATHDPAYSFVSPVDETETVTVSGGLITGGNVNDIYGYGAGILVSSTGTLTLEGGTIGLNGTESSIGYGSGVGVQNGTFVMNGGAISGNTAYFNGGGICIWGENARFTMNGGIINGNTARDGGGGGYIRDNAQSSMTGGEICCNSTGQGGGLELYAIREFTMSGGKIDNNIATGIGGGICFSSADLFTMTGGEISGNHATKDGGGVFASCSVNMSGDSVIRDNYGAAGAGINISKYTYSLEMSGNALIQGNQGTSSGGGICAAGSSVINLSGNALVDGNVAGGAGGGIHSGAITLSGNSGVTNNVGQSGRGGGGIVVGDFLNISDEAKVSGNSFTGDLTYYWGGGGGIHTQSGPITMTGGEISGNTSSGDGGGIGLYYYGTLIMSDGVIQGNHADRSGGGVYNEDYDDGHLQVSGTPVIWGNTAGEDKIDSNVLQNVHSRKTVILTGPLEEGAKIGVMPNSFPSQGSPYIVSNNYYEYNTEDPALFFVSDIGAVVYEGTDNKTLMNTPFQYLSIRLSRGENITLTEDLYPLENETNAILNFNGGDDRLEVTLDLNGHIIDAKKNSDFVMYTRNGTLNIKDSNPQAAHSPAFTYVNPITQEEVTVTGGIITGSKESYGIAACYGTTVNFSGGTIAGNGSGLYIAGADFNFTGGTICGNSGFGAWAYEGARLNMSGGAIRHNGGKGVYLYNNQSSYSILNLSGGVIEENVSGSDVAGISRGNRGSVCVFGNPVVRGNLSNGVERNIAYPFSVTDAMTEGADIRIDGTPGTDYPYFVTSGYTKYNEDVDPAQFFHPVNPDCVMDIYDDEACMFSKVTISFNAGGGSGTMDSITDYHGDFPLPQCDFIAPSETQRFKNWYINRNYYNPGDVYKVLFNTEIKAMWEEIPRYTMTFVTNGGTPVDRRVLLEGTPYGELPVSEKTGYTLAGWFTDATEGTQISETDLCMADITVYAHWTANTDTVYTVEHYQQNLENSYYSLADTDSLTGTTDTEVTPEVKDYEGFTAPATQTVTIKPDGSTLVRYEYTRNSYELGWDFNGGTVTSSGYSEGTLKFGTAITAPVLERAGYTLSGWSEKLPETMPGRDLQLKAVWTANTDIPYTVEHYQQNLENDEFTLTDTENLKGTTDAEISPAVKDYEGFTAPATQTVTVKADGSTLVKYEYTRNSYQLVWDFDGGNASGEYTQGTVKFGTTIVVPTVTKPGQRFAGWTVEIPETMPSNDLEIKANWTISVVDVFDDINEGDWFVNAVQFVYDRGIMGGKSATQFQPGVPIRREEFTRVLYNQIGKPAVSIDNPYPDVKEGQWYFDSVLWAKENNIANGKADKEGVIIFGVGQNITREELALMLYKYALLLGYDTSADPGASDGFADTDRISGWAKNAMDWAVTQGVMSGKGGDGAPKSELRLDPKGNATRAECASMIKKLMEKNGQ